MVIPIDRARLALRALLWGFPAVLLGVIAVMLYGSLNFVPSGVSNRLVDYALGVVALPIPLFSIYALGKAVRLLLIAAWPGKSGVFASPDLLELRLGPFRRKYDSARLKLQYPFEVGEETGDRPFEAYLPEEEQMERFLPLMTHPQAASAINQEILRYCTGTEAELTGRLRPMIEYWRGTGASSHAPGG